MGGKGPLSRNKTRLPIRSSNKTEGLKKMRVLKSKIFKHGKKKYIIFF